MVVYFKMGICRLSVLGYLKAYTPLIKKTDPYNTRRIKIIYRLKYLKK